MARVVTEIAARNKMKQGLDRARADVKAWRQGVRDQMKGLKNELKADSKGGGILTGMTAGVTKGNLMAMAIMKTAQAAREGVENVGELVDAAEQLGVSAEDIGKLERVMEGSGVKAENLRKAFMQLNDVQSQVKSGSDDAAKKFAALGVSAEEVKSLRLDELFFRVADGMRGIGDDGAAAAAVIDLIGTRNARMMAVMRKGGEELKQEMAEVSSAVSATNAKLVDDAADSVQSGFSAVKGFLVNVAGGTLRLANDTGKAVDRIKQKAEEATEVSEQDAHVQDHLVEQAKKRKLEAEEHLKNVEREKEISEQVLESAKDLLELEQEETKNAEEFLTLKEKTQLLMKRMRQEEATKPANEAERHQQMVRQKELQMQLDAVREQKIEREMMSPAERAAANRDERNARKRRERAKRAVDGRERDRIMSAFRDGRMTDGQARFEMQKLRANTKDNKVLDPDVQLLKDIKTHVETMANKVAIA